MKSTQSAKLVLTGRGTAVRFQFRSYLEKHFREPGGVSKIKKSQASEVSRHHISQWQDWQCTCRLEFLIEFRCEEHYAALNVHVWRLQMQIHPRVSFSPFGSNVKYRSDLVQRFIEQRI